MTAEGKSDKTAADMAVQRCGIEFLDAGKKMALIGNYRHLVNVSKAQTGNVSAVWLWVVSAVVTVTVS